MIRYKNECCDCAVAGYPCLGNRCPNQSVPHCYCDMCGQEIYDEPHNECGMDICEQCFRKEESDGNESD